MADKKKTCFVIMPISTHDNHLPSYRNDKDHFKHVLGHLFAPGIKAIDYELTPPIAKGADVIHAAIIKNLEEADLVLCDMSTLNPNVFFELGIRTALNKPVCVVKDDKTPVIPFDIGIINSHTYSSGLDAWTLENDITILKEHIEESIKRSGSENMLWRQFGITNVAKEYEHKAGDNPKMDYVMIQVDAIKQELENQKKERANNESVFSDVLHRHILGKHNLAFDIIANFLINNGLTHRNISFESPNIYTVQLRGGKVTKDLKKRIEVLAEDLDVQIKFI